MIGQMSSAGRSLTEPLLVAGHGRSGSARSGLAAERLRVLRVERDPVRERANRPHSGAGIAHHAT